MPTRYPNFIGLVALFATMLSTSPMAKAGPDLHAQEDTFAAEAAALLPKGDVPIAQATAPLDRITLGEWGAIIPWTPHIPVSAATLPDGRLLTFASNQRTTFPSGSEFTYAATWNPATGQFLEFNHPSHDMFCGALVMLPDGRVLVNGGRNTTVRSSIFDWRNNTWTRTPDMNDPRWYNTSVALPNGRVWTVSGSGGSGTAERWDQASGWSRLTGINWNLVTGEPGYITIWHPFLLLAPDGRLIHFGPTDTMHWVTSDGSGSMSNTGTTVPGAHYPKEGSWVMYNEGRILVAGGGANTTANSSGDNTTGTSTTLAYMVDVRSGTPVVTPTTSMRFARQFANVVVLPNGEVMVMGGNTSGLKFNDTGSILTPEIWNPTTGQWRSMADANVPRNYHSLALLLPDGRVMSGGGGLGGGDHRDAQLFTPPNLFNADGSLAIRPVLNTAPSSISVGTRFLVSGTPGIQKFSFIKMSAITHSVNTDLRYLSLPFTETSSGNYDITAHSSLNVMTPGYWMLFGLNAAGVHSVAKIVLVDATTTVDVLPSGNQSSYVGQSVSLQMIGSGPAGSVLTWSATGLPGGLSINPTTGQITGTATQQGTFSVRVTLSNGGSSDFEDFTWTIQPQTLSQNFANFTGASGLTFNGNAAISGSALRLTPNLANQVGSAFLSNPVAIGVDSSISTRFVFRVHGTADGADGLTFVIQGNGPSSLGLMGAGLGYDGMAKSLAVEIDNYLGGTDPNANHLGILSNGSVTAHLATFAPGWDLEDGQSHTVWVEYDGPANQLRVYAAQGIVTQRPASPVMTASIDLPALVGSQAWFGFTGATGGAFNNHDIEAWSLTVNAFALPAQPVLTNPGNQITVVGSAVNRQMQATDPNGDLLTWSATGLPSGLSINPSSGLISGAPTVAGGFSPTVTVTDGNTLPVSTSFTWTINNVLIVQPLSGPAVPAGTTVSLTAQSSGGLNPRYRWNFGDGSPDTAFSASPSTSHLFSNPGRYLVTVTVRDDTAREVTASYRQGVFASLTAAKPTASSSIAYEDRSGANDRLWVVNPDNDSVTVFDVVTRAKLAEVNVGRAPRTLAIAVDGRVWVANTEGATITILRPDYSVAQTVNLQRGSRPFGIVFDPAGQNAYVALEDAGKILKLDPATGATIASLEVGLHVRHLSITADGAQILATRFVTPRLPGEETANVQTTVGNVNYGGEVLAISTATFTIDTTVILQHSEQPDTSNSGRGIPNYLGAAVISPDGQSAWVPSKQDNIKRGTLRGGSVLTHDMTMRSIASRIILATRSEDLGGRIDFDNAGIPSAAAFNSNGIFLFTTLEGSREIAVADAWAKQEILRFDAGRAPQGLVLSPDGRTLYVQNFMDRTVTIHDLNALANGAETAPPAPLVLNCVTTEKLTTPVLRGKQFFYDTRDTRVAFQQYIACAACHNDGGQDGRIWDFTQFGEGLRNTITLRGREGVAHGPLHWTGNFDEVQDFEGQIRNFALGTGLMSDADFHAGTRSQPLGDPKAGLSTDLDALAAYVSSLTKFGDSPYRNADGTFTSEAVSGRIVFQNQNCASCHAGTRMTDSALNVFHDIGTLKPSSGKRLNATLPGIDTPTLLGLWQNSPYLHDGSAATLEEAISAHNGVSLGAGDMSNLVAFLRQLDDIGDAAVPAIITWTDPAAINYGTALSGAQLNATANTSGTFVYNPPLGTILNAGNDQALSVTFTPDDTANYGSATATVSLDVLRASLTITAQNQSKVYGAAVPALTASYSGFVNGDTAASLDAPVTLSTVATAGSPVGSYTINAGGAADANYTIAFVSGTLSVTRAALSITAQDKVKVYGAANPALTAAYSGFVNGDTAASLDAAVTLATTATTSSGVGSYPITASGAADANYTITHVNGTLAVTRASLTVRADDKSRPVNQPNPPLTATYTGFVNGDTAASLDSPVSLSTPATQSSPAGTYPITASGAADANYAVTHVNGTLAVTPAFAVKINFQPASSAVPAGYLPDGGSVFANRGNGYTYGWNVSNTSFTRDRNSTRSPDQRYDTLNHMQKSSGARSWEIAVPNGTYNVFVVSGDADHTDSVFRVNVEGVLTVSGTPTTSTRWVSGTRTVTVNDGRLTVSNGSGASNNKICFIDITSTPVAGSGIVQAAGGIRLGWVEGGASGHITLRVEGIEIPGALCEIEASSDLTTWHSLGVLPVIEGTVSFNDLAGHAQRFYRVRSGP
jgi:YVTN family beta-propeller protein